MLSTFATVIRFWWQYHHSPGNWIGFQKWAFNLENFVKKRYFVQKWYFSKNQYTLNMFWFTWKLVFWLIRLCWFQIWNLFGSRTPHSRVEIFCSTFYNNSSSKKTFLSKNFKLESPIVKASLICNRMMVLSPKSETCSKRR